MNTKALPRIQADAAEDPTQIVAHPESMPAARDTETTLGSRHLAPLRPVPAAAHRPAAGRQRGRNWTNTLLPTGLDRAVACRPLARHLVSQGLREQPGGGALSACAINTVLALPLAYALYHGARRGGSWRHAS